MKRPGRRHILPFAGVGLLLLAGFLWFINSRGGLVTALNIPPTRDASTPASQNGYTLLTVQKPDDGVGSFQFTPPSQGMQQGPTQTQYASGDEYSVAGLWIQMPDGSGNPATLQVTGHAASGRAFPLRPSYPFGGGRGNLLFTAIPGGYAGSMPYVDVIVSDGQQHTARWRINRLPVMKHVLITPLPTSNAFSTAGVTLDLRATRRLGRYGEYVRYQLFPSVAPASHQWQIWMQGNPVETDWMPFYSDKDRTTAMLLTGKTTDEVMAFNHGAVIDEFIQHPYVREDHFVRFHCRLQQFETYDEKVTFHNVQIQKEDAGDIFRVSQRQSVTTPSGIQVTLPVQSKATFMHQGILEDPGLLVEVQPHAQKNQLPNSPLVKQYNRPVGITIHPAKPDYSSLEDMGPGLTRKIMLRVPDSKLTTGSQARDLSLIVRQRVDLQTLPVTLTAPITDDTASQKS